MNEIVAKFIEEQKQKKQEEFNRLKKQHLIELGLIDEQKSKPKEYLDGPASQWYREMHGFTQCDEKGWYKNSPQPVDVTDEEYEEICKLCPPQNKTTENNIKTVKKYYSANVAESFVKFFALVNFVISIIVVLALLVASDTFNWITIGIGVAVLVSTMLTWALPLVIVNISQKLDNL